MCLNQMLEINFESYLKKKKKKKKKKNSRQQ